MRALAVEDYEIAARSLARLARRAGIDMTVASTATEAYARIHEDGADAFDAFVLDLRLPEGDEAGLELLAWVRERAPATPAVLLTAFVDEGVRRRALALDALYIVKPVDGPEMTMFLRALAATSEGDRVARRLAWATRTYQLTPREAEVLAWVASGRDADEFSRVHRVSKKTFYAHSESILEKTGASSVKRFVLDLLRAEPPLK